MTELDNQACAHRHIEWWQNSETHVTACGWRCIDCDMRFGPTCCATRQEQAKIESLVAALAEKDRRITELAAALKEYGEHKRPCVMAYPDPCSCGLGKLDPAAILAEHDKALAGPLEARIVELEGDVWSDPELLAHFFHDEYERLAPAYGYETRKDSDDAWADVPEKDKALMIAVCESVIEQRRDAAREGA